MHVLSHMERDGVSSVGADFIKVNPIDPSLIDTGYRDPDHSANLDALYQDLRRIDPNLIQCSECRLTMLPGELKTHFQTKIGEPVHCDEPNCGMALPNKCSASAHERAHSRQAPLVCPECGVTWETWRSYAAHAQDSCHHDARVLALACKVCLASNAVGASSVIDAAEILSHMYFNHVKLYFKCSSCKKAYDNKESIYSHREEVHKSEAEDGKVDFHVLYKASFMKVPNLFNSRDAFEQKIHKMAKK